MYIYIYISFFFYQALLNYVYTVRFAFLNLNFGNLCIVVASMIAWFKKFVP